MWRQIRGNYPYLLDAMRFVRGNDMLYPPVQLLREREHITVNTLLSSLKELPQNERVRTHLAHQNVYLSQEIPISAAKLQRFQSPAPLRAPPRSYSP